VQINPSYYKRPLRDELITALAGPAMNIFLAIIGMLIMMTYASIADVPLTDPSEYPDLITPVTLSLASFP
jgi:Zn-dependent protease